MKQGDKIKFTNETEDEKKAREAGIEISIVWIDEPRAGIELHIRGMTINPTQVVNLEDIELL